MKKTKELHKRWGSGKERTFHPGRGSLTAPESTSLLPKDSKTNIWRLVMWLPTSQLWPMPTAPPTCWPHTPEPFCNSCLEATHTDWCFASAARQDPASQRSSLNIQWSTAHSIWPDHCQGPGFGKQRWKQTSLPSRTSLLVGNLSVCP